MKKNKGFTLVELLAVIAVLGIIMVIVGVNVSKAVKDSRIKAKFIAAKEIVTMASAYITTENPEGGCVEVKTLINEDYLEKDLTNPATGENGGDFTKQRVCREDVKKQTDYELKENSYYLFDNYKYYVK